MSERISIRPSVSGTGAANDMSDRELVHRVVDYGDEDAFRRLYRRHTPYLLQFVLRIQARSEADAEDIVQETWVRAASGFERFRWESTLRTWLGAIALNLTRNWLRDNARRLPNLHHYARAASPSPIPERLDLERAIAQLPDGYRLVLVLHDIEGFKHAEIAERLGIQPVTSRTQLYKARGALRDMLASAASAGPSGPSGDGSGCRGRR